MNVMIRVVALAALVGTIAPSLLLLGGHISEPAMRTSMLAATIVWFVVAPFWMLGSEGRGRDNSTPEHSVTDAAGRPTI
ncbi:hypothetical protein Pla175_35720 [Pirellulimonas nuda]|uniref:Uncharacterized protein n=1 Tax=Pirellulimonas nuda TaxID=2528009 RepID=A0A518DFC5_9BACT|nr:hypothetical protein [Pirellulimonas nuda]QDU90170.1 hypothetical protein Pla175_35720 [Pirellulimonas nuda]